MREKTHVSGVWKFLFTVHCKQGPGLARNKLVLCSSTEKETETRNAQENMMWPIASSQRAALHISGHFFCAWCKQQVSLFPHFQRNKAAYHHLCCVVMSRCGDHSLWRKQQCQKWSSANSYNRSIYSLMVCSEPVAFLIPVCEAKGQA